MASHHEIANRWLNVALGTTTKKNYGNRSHNMFGEGDTLYSYGRHFPLAHLVRNAKGEPTLLLLNGDRFSMTTTRHQSATRSMAQGSYLPHVIIPFSALQSAGIDLGSIELVEATADRHETKRHRSYEQPAGSRWVTRDVSEYVDLNEEELAAKVDAKLAKAVEDWNRIQGYIARGDTFWENKPEPKREDMKLMDWDKREYRKVGERTDLLASLSKWRTIEVNTDEDGRTVYEWDSYRHWLGESLVKAKIRWIGSNRKGERVWRERKAYFLSGFDHQERRPLYFFCELPKSAKPETIAEAYEDLKPQAVKLGEKMNRTIVRQGDIFAIALDDMNRRTLNKLGARFEKRGQLLGTNHVATETAYLPDGTTLVRGMLYHAPQWRQPDHARQKLAEGWSVVIKNTVPVSI